MPSSWSFHPSPEPDDGFTFAATAKEDDEIMATPEPAADEYWGSKKSKSIKTGLKKGKKKVRRPVYDSDPPQIEEESPDIPPPAESVSASSTPQYQRETPSGFEAFYNSARRRQYSPPPSLEPYGVEAIVPTEPDSAPAPAPTFERDLPVPEYTEALAEMAVPPIETETDECFGIEDLNHAHDPFKNEPEAEYHEMSDAAHEDIIPEPQDNTAVECQPYSRPTSAVDIAVPVSHSPEQKPATQLLFAPTTIERSSAGRKKSSLAAGQHNDDKLVLKSVSPPSRGFLSPQMAARSRFVEPPPPHQAQAHFYGLPDFLNLAGQRDPVKDGKPAGADGYCCVFDSFADSGDLGSFRRAKDALLVGSEGGLDVYRVLPNKLEIVGHLEGLRGSVIGAKVLPHVDVFDTLQTLRPLIAICIHRPVNETQGQNSDDKKADDGSNDIIAHYQTTVEVYSLRTQQQISTLYKSTTVPVKAPSIGQLTSLPGPIGDLSVSARGKFVVVSSGKSGEIFIFTMAQRELQSQPPSFRCIGKYWTSLQTPLDAARPSSQGDASVSSVERSGDKPGVALFSLGQRWLALVSPMVSTHSSILGTPKVSEESPTPLGLATHIAPSPPPFTCDVAGIDEEGAFGRLTRQAAQGIVKYSQKGIEMGVLGWKELTNPTQSLAQQSQHGRSLSRDRDQFPPTNAPPSDPRRVTKEPAIVSIVDLDRLLEAEEMKLKYPPLPIATFPLTDGCNFLSLSSNGLRLLTVTRTGETCTIWDLHQLCHGSTKLQFRDEEELLSPTVRQIIRIPRTSQTVVVDSAWSEDDDFLALLTNHGTVHLHEVPLQLPSRKRRRRITITEPAAEKADAVVGLSSGVSPPSSNNFFGTLKSGWQSVSTGVNSIRAQNTTSNFGISTTLAGLKVATTSAGHAGGRLVVKGLSQGYMAAKGGASDYWHHDDNKIRHRALTEYATGRTLRWIRRPSGASLAITAGGSVHLHSVVRVTRQRGEDAVTGLKHERNAKNFTLQTIQTRDKDSIPRDAEPADDCAAQGPHGYWTLRSTGLNERPQQVNDKPRAPFPPNDVETNPPYCPFHVDARVNIYGFDSDVVDTSFAMLGHGFDDGDDERQQWSFGAALPQSLKLNTHDDPLHDLSLGRSGGDPTYSDDELIAQVESHLTVRAASEHSVANVDSARAGTHSQEIHVHSRQKPLDTHTGETSDDEIEFGIFE